MKKTSTKPTKSDDKLRNDLHDLWDSCDDEMDKQELKHFLDDENQPKMALLNEDNDKLGVEQVLTIGAYMTLQHIHQLLHERDAEEIHAQVNDVLDGKVDFRTITPENMPEELVDLLDNIVNRMIKKRKSGGNK